MEWMVYELNSPVLKKKFQILGLKLKTSLYNILFEQMVITLLNSTVESDDIVFKTFPREELRWLLPFLS